MYNTSQARNTQQGRRNPRSLPRASAMSQGSHGFWVQSWGMSRNSPGRERRSKKEESQAQRHYHRGAGLVQENGLCCRQEGSSGSWGQTENQNPGHKGTRAPRWQVSSGGHQKEIFSPKVRWSDIRVRKRILGGGWFGEKKTWRPLYWPQMAGRMIQIQRHLRGRTSGTQ